MPVVAFGVKFNTETIYSRSPSGRSIGILKADDVIVILRSLVARMNLCSISCSRGIVMAYCRPRLVNPELVVTKNSLKYAV